MTRVTRRRFIKDAAAALTLATAGTLAPTADIFAQQAPQNAQAQAVQEYNVPLNLAKTKVTLHVLKKADPNILYFLPHYDEEPAPAATEAHVRTVGGTMVSLRHLKKDRYIRFLGGSTGKTNYRVDPNRTYTEKGVRDHTQFSKQDKDDPKRTIWVPTARAATRATVKGFSDGLLAAIKPGQWDAVVAVHNNTLGGYGFNSYTAGSSAYLADDVFAGDPANPDNFFYVTWKEDFEALKALGKFNVVLQKASAVKPGTIGDDGSLSVWAQHAGKKDAKTGQKKPVRYINVEVQNADKHRDIERYDRNLTIQQEMLQAAHTILTRK